jgi:predicted acyl esterase
LSITWEQNLELRLSDGETLRADVWRPAKPGRYPTLLIREPYGKRNAENVTYAHPSWYAQQGFAVVAQDVRGRGESGGEFVPFGTEAEDGEATVVWVAEQPFCDCDGAQGDGAGTDERRLLRGMGIQERRFVPSLRRLLGLHACR